MRHFVFWGGEVGGYKSKRSKHCSATRSHTGVHWGCTICARSRCFFFLVFFLSSIVCQDYCYLIIYSCFNEFSEQTDEAYICVWAAGKQPTARSPIHGLWNVTWLDSFGDQFNEVWRFFLCLMCSAPPETDRQPRSLVCPALGLLQPPADESSPVYDPASDHSESPRRGLGKKIKNVVFSRKLTSDIDI